MNTIENKLNAARTARLEDDGGLIETDPSDVTAVQFNSYSEALRRKDPLHHAAIQRAITLKFYQSQMIPKVDYGTIQGCGSKPVLFKAGAEKLLTLFDLSVSIEPHRDHEDWDRGVFAYSFKATVKDRRNRPVAECFGGANSKEKKFAKQDAFTIQNTLMKMSQKRAVVGAVLLAVNASSLFQNGEAELSQDLSVDGDRPIWDAEVIEPDPQPATITQAQIKRLFAISKEAGHTKESLYRLLSTLEIDSTRAIAPNQYEGICSQASNREMAEFFRAQVEAEGSEDE